MSQIKINDIEIRNGLEVKFKTYNKTDSQTYYGTILGVVDFTIALAYGDMIAQHENMEPQIAKLEPSSLTYLLVRTSDKAIRAFAVDWINEASFSRTDTTNDETIVIFDVTKDELTKIMTYIRDLGHDCRRK